MLKKSLKNINWKLYLVLIIMGLCPTIYTTLRIFFIGQLPNEYTFSIAGQLSWVNLLYEVLNEAIILPLFFFMGGVVNDKKEFTNRLKSGLLISLIIYSFLSIIIIIFARPLLIAMAASHDIINESMSYIRIESVANIFGILYSFASIALVSLGEHKPVYILTFTKLFLCIIFDTFLISSFPISLHLGVNGIGYSNIMINIILFFLVLFLLYKKGFNVFEKNRIKFSWLKGFFKVGGLSGLESFIRNFAYIIMVSRMVNVVGEQGTYWVANNFIWGWMLLPITQLGELIKQETASEKNAIQNNSLAYFTITIVVCILWAVFIPIYKPFMKYLLGFSDVEKLFKLVMVLFIFYVMYAIQNVFDSTFYGRGKTSYMLIESITTNTLYYGTFFILYITNIWTPTLIGIVLMFGFGSMFDSLVSGILYWHYLKKNKIQIFNNKSL